MDAKQRYSKSAPGPFYVVRDECMSCGAPESVADGLMSRDEEQSSGCFFVRQPATEHETNAAILAVMASCCGAVRYGGKDPETLRRLAALDHSDELDHANLVPGTPTASTCARFRFRDGDDDSARGMMTAIMAFVRKALADEEVYLDDHVVKMGDIKLQRDRASFRYSWRNRYAKAEVRFAVAPEPDGWWILRIEPNNSWSLHLRRGSSVAIGDAILLDGEMKKDARFQSIGWLAPGEAENLDFRGRPLPY